LTDAPPVIVTLGRSEKKCNPKILVEGIPVNNANNAKLFQPFTNSFSCCLHVEYIYLVVVPVREELKEERLNKGNVLTQANID